MYALKLYDPANNWWLTSRPLTLAQAWRGYKARRSSGKRTMLIRICESYMGMPSGPEVLAYPGHY